LVASRGTPVIFLQSDFGYAEPGSAYWPSYASAGFFGEGVRNLNKTKTNRDGSVKLDDEGQPINAECWGGVQKSDDGGPTGRLAFPEEAMLTAQSMHVSTPSWHFKVIGQGMQLPGGGCMGDCLAGILVAGGGAITAEQVEIYNVDMGHSRRPHDKVIPAIDMKGKTSGTSRILLSDWELTRVKDVFELLDHDSSGTVDLRDLQDNHNFTSGYAASFIEKIDTDKSGDVTEQEFIHFMANLRATHGNMHMVLVMREITLLANGYLVNGSTRLSHPGVPRVPHAVDLTELRRVTSSPVMRSPQNRQFTSSNEHGLSINRSFSSDPEDTFQRGLSSVGESVQAK